MRVPVSWLRELCDPGLEADALAERLSMTGTEVERVSRLGVASGDGFVVGRVLTAEPHPDADRLRVCTRRRRRRASRGRSSAARRTSPPGRPSRSRCRGP